MNSLDPTEIKREILREKLANQSAILAAKELYGLSEEGRIYLENQNNSFEQFILDLLVKISVFNENEIYGVLAEVLIKKLEDLREEANHPDFCPNGLDYFCGQINLICRTLESLKKIQDFEETIMGYDHADQKNKN